MPIYSRSFALERCRGWHDIGEGEVHLGLPVPWLGGSRWDVARSGSSFPPLPSPPSPGQARSSLKRCPVKHTSKISLFLNFIPAYDVPQALHVSEQPPLTPHSQMSLNAIEATPTHRLANSVQIFGWEKMRQE